MTRRNDKRNNRRNRQRNNQPELSSFAQMLFGAILGKGAEMIANKMKEKDENTLPSIQRVSPTRIFRTSTKVMLPYLSCLSRMMVRL